MLGDVTFVPLVGVTVGFAVTCWLSLKQPHLFEDVATEVGYQFYAERLHILPLKVINHAMPFNTLICYVYSILGLYWLIHSVVALRRESVGSEWKTVGVVYVFSFSLMSLLYGPVHLMRIVSQTHQWAVLDQWFTLPFFGLVGHFLATQQLSPNRIPSQSSLLLAILLSHLSYLLSLLHPLGFEFVLAIHIFLCVSLGIPYFIHSSVQSRVLIAKATLSCLGFVVLKLLDLYLADVHLMFEILSGHFLSKVCDVLQIYYLLLILEGHFFGSELSSEAQRTPSKKIQ